ncbi:hypothetical protein BAE44_0010948 [Dichanthelium oligosanthes]|uniref:Uncharacterized protein n=1 Tax=Dichanthelium oligosanthes TaxID=888268 RepID=A0A1E5VSE6_9POAL|nr:hypothetical protein BAE44_0010948 [Dichanthelium oligosanthes]
MGSRGGTSGNASSSWLRLVLACLALCLLLSHLSPCEGRKLLVADDEGGNGKVMDFAGDDLVLRVPPPPSIIGNGGASVVVESSAVLVPRGFTASGRAARLMRSVPSPGVGH